MDSYSKIVHNVTKFIRVAIEDRPLSIRNDTKPSTTPYFIMKQRHNCRAVDSLPIYFKQ